MERNICCRQVVAHGACAMRTDVDVWCFDWRHWRSQGHLQRSARRLIQPLYQRVFPLPFPLKSGNRLQMELIIVWTLEDAGNWNYKFADCCSWMLIIRFSGVIKRAMHFSRNNRPKKFSFTELVSVLVSTKNMQLSDHPIIADSNFRH